MSDAEVFVVILAIAAVTAMLRFAPFLVMGDKKTPKYIEYLGKVLPYSVMAMLVVYCLKDVEILKPPFALCEAVSLLVVVLLHKWKRNSLLSIICGTACYMLLIRII